jgi:two-component system, chemotaxis family, sensor kinase CheA
VNLDAATHFRLVGLFVAEAEEALRELGATHRRLADGSGGEDLLVFGRTAHGLKGAAAALGFRPLAQVIHKLEEVSLGLAGSSGPAREERHGRLALALELLDQGVAHMSVAGLSSFPAGVTEAIGRALDDGEEAGAAEGPVAGASEAGTAAGPAPASVPVPESVAERLSVPATDVDEALRLAASLARAVAQLQGSLAGVDGPLAGATQGLAARAERLEAIIAGLRLLPAEVALSGLKQEVDALASALGKQVVLTVEGREVRADRRTLQAARGTLRHLVRNAVDHGIETPSARSAAGKPPAGILSLRVTSAEGALQVTVADDGAGFDVVAAREALVRRGDDAARILAMPESEVLARFAAEGGSTRQQVTEVSGRGLGLSAVAALARDAGGAFSVRSELGRGSAVTFSLPLDVYSVEALVVSAGERTLGIPVQALERTVLLHASDLTAAGPTGRTLAAGESIVPLIGLAETLGLDTEPGGERFALVLHGVDGAVALAVDDIGAVVAVVPSPAPGAAGAGALVAGLARLADGTTLQVLDPRGLVAAARAAARRPRPQRQQPAPVPAADAAAPRPEPGPIRARRDVVLAEDSLATREVLRVLLEEQGFVVRLAADGEEALARIRERLPDVVVTDVNMPRRDGLSLARAIRADPAMARLPVILLTSQDDEPARAAGASAGADAYLVKSRFDAGVLAATLARIGVGPASRSEPGEMT